MAIFDNEPDCPPCVVELEPVVGDPKLDCVSDGEALKFLELAPLLVALPPTA